MDTRERTAVFYVLAECGQVSGPKSKLEGGLVRGGRSVWRKDTKWLKADLEKLKDEIAPELRFIGEFD